MSATTGVHEIRLPVRLSAESISDLLRQLGGPVDGAVVVLRGSGSFCEGLDLAGVGASAPGSLERAVFGFAEVLRTLQALPRPLLAVVEGRAAGGGVGLAAACDVVLAGSDATFALPEAIFGLTPAIVGPLVAARVGAPTLRRLTLTASAIDAQEALRLGLADAVAGAQAGNEQEAHPRTEPHIGHRPAPSGTLGDGTLGLRSRSSRNAAAIERPRCPASDRRLRTRRLSMGGRAVNPVTLLPPTDGVAWIEMSDEAGTNGLSQPMIDGIVGALEAVASEPDVRTIVLAGTQRWFCSGATRETLRDVVSHRISPAELTLGLKLLQAPVPVIAAVEGDTLGGGFALMLACDLLVLSSSSRHCANFMTLGITPGMGITHLLGSAVGPALANELLYTGRSLRADELPAGVVNAVVERPKVRPAAESLAWSVASNDRDNLRLLKSTLSLPRREALQRAMSMEALMHESSLARFDERQMT